MPPSQAAREVHDYIYKQSNGLGTRTEADKELEEKAASWRYYSHLKVSATNPAKYQAKMSAIEASIPDQYTEKFEHLCNASPRRIVYPEF
jgi:hypothetical protein